MGDMLAATLEDLVISKYYFAGGSCRYMFSLNSNEVRNEICTAIQSTDDMIPYLNGSVGELAGPRCMNVLLSSFPDDTFTISSMQLHN